MSKISETAADKPHKEIILEYYGAIRESRGLSRESVMTCAEDIDELFKELASQNLIPYPRNILSVAINDEFGSFSSVIKNGDKVVFMTPVAGG
ncbi:MoaD/ThiS family protein [bacterium]|nr:MAG: ThiS family protein [Candidatus Hinthialibacteria bacterium OLB16]MCK6495531.1 MoaD/ThiS family protein [bacterium]NUP92334.1 MoaD/ThiS family protein [Candidatus Omnitrophota bacterium]